MAHSMGRVVALLQRLSPGLAGLLYGELHRVVILGVHSLLGPVIAAMLFLLVFTKVFEGQGSEFAGVSFGAFILPGIAMMTMLQQSFASSALSLTLAKSTGSIVFVLLSPIAALAFFLSYLLAALACGAAVVVILVACGALFTPVEIAHPWWALAFLVLGGAMAGGLGVLCGVWAKNFEQVALFQSFIMLPFTFLAGVFYSVSSLPPALQPISRYNPFAYIVDGFRYGFVGQADNSIEVNLVVAVLSCLIPSALAFAMIKTGYKLRN